jgi:DNA-binding NarL/FixJ family response regulator
MSDSIIHVAIADDQHLFRQCLVTNISQLPHLKVIIEAENGRELISMLETATTRPDVVLLDLNMPEINGVETTAIIQNAWPGMKIIILSVYCEPRHIVFMIEKGINSFLSKSASLEEVGQAITTVHNHGFYFTEDVMKAMQRMDQKSSKFYFDVAESLTRREKEVLELICKEQTTPEIAKRLFLSERTVEGHRNNLLLKTGARNTAGLVIFALRNKLVDLGI